MKNTKKVDDNLHQAETMAEDPELKDMAQNEIEELSQKLEELKAKLEIL